MALVGAIAAPLLASASIVDLLGYDRGPTSYVVLVATLVSCPLFFGIVPNKWLVRARPEVQDPILAANALLELGRLAPENGERAFDKAFGLYEQVTKDAPHSYAAVYGCGLALYELARLSPERTNLHQLDRAQHWFKRALTLDSNPELLKFVADIDEYRESIRTR